eukprot:TRINITY_DN40892_c2_g2_i1.p5 TRINITY_DN40892_c2_g2~~TRINITY_DN40892_c2_g2_i1.p5  ORF type:complete len:106 (-),score=7.60 TRINITY_DN40892_c2_g2_i1:184-501(-)
MASEYTTTEYIKHHLTNASMCSTDSGIAFNKACADAGFWTWHVDTLAWSIGLGLLFLWYFRSVAKKASTGVPTKTQAFVQKNKNSKKERRRVQDIDVIIRRQKER